VYDYSPRQEFELTEDEDLPLIRDDGDPPAAAAAANNAKKTKEMNVRYFIMAEDSVVSTPYFFFL